MRLLLLTAVLSFSVSLAVTLQSNFFLDGSDELLIQLHYGSSTNQLEQHTPHLPDLRLSNGTSDPCLRQSKLRRGDSTHSSTARRWWAGVGNTFQGGEAIMEHSVFLVGQHIAPDPFSKSR